MNEAFIACARDSMFCTGCQLRTATSTARAHPVSTHQIGASACRSTESPGRSTRHTASGRIGSASTMASQLSHAKLPLMTSQSWVTIMIAAQVPATGCGRNKPNGTTSWVTWFAATSTRCNGFGNRWKYQLNGPGIGCVSWW